MRKTQYLFYLLINFVIRIYAGDEQLTKDFELSKSSCMDIYKYFESTDVGYYFECKTDKKPNKFVLSIGHSQQFNKVTFKIKFLVSQNIEKDNFEILVDNNNIQEFQMVKEGEKSYQIQVSQTDAKGSIQLDIKQDKQNAGFKVQKATLSLLIKNCDKYKDNGQCQKCDSQYFLDQMTGICSDYKTNCENFENKKCKKCNNGYLLNNSGFCTIYCQDGKKKYYNTCVDQCPTGFYSDNEKFCQKCGDFCTFCLSNDTCLQCEENRYFQDGVCRENCSDGYFVSTQESTNGQLICEQCDESCLTCTGSSQNECVTCGEDLILYLGNSCVLQCPEGYFKKSNSSSENIQKIKNSSYYCEKCYYLDQKCLEKCPSQTFLLENNVCKTCSTKNCADCSANDICKICQNEFILNEKNQCVECNQNTYYDAQNKYCKICPDANCLDCSSKQNGKVCKKCKQYYQFNGDKLVCQFNDTEYLLECANPSNCTKEQNIVKASDATISIISISNTVLLLFSFAFFPIGPFFWYTVQVQQQIGNLILINNLKILSLGPTVIQNFYQYNLFPLFPDSTFNTYDETNLLYASSSQLSIMSAFRSQPLKKYFINNMAYFFIFLFIVILIYCVSKCINRKYIRILNKQQAQNKLKVKERDCYHDNNIFDNSYNLNIRCSLDSNTSKMNKTQNQVNQIGQNLLIKNKNQIQKQNEKRLNFYSKNQSFLKLIEFNLFIRFQMVFGNYFLLCLLYSVSKLSLKSTFDYVDLGVKSFFSLIYIIFVCFLTYKMSTFDELNFTQDCSKFKVVFSHIKTQGLKKYFWIFLECRKFIQVSVLVFVQQDLIKISAVLGTNLLFLIYLLHQKPISYSIYQKFIIVIEVIIGFLGVCVVVYQILSESMINYKFISTILAIMALTILNFIVLGFLIMQIYMFVKFKYFPRFYILENKVIDTTLLRFDQGEDFKNSRFFNDLTNSDIDYYSKLWGINPTFAKKIYQEAQEEFRKKYEQEEIRAQQQLELKEQSKQKVVENKLQSQKSSTFTHKEVHGMIKEKKKLQKILSQSIQFKQNNLRSSRQNIEYNKFHINNLFSKGNIFAKEQSQNKIGFSPNNSQQIQQNSSIVELQNTSKQIFEQSTGSSTQQQKLIKLNKSQNNNQSSQEQLQKELFSSNYDSN
ncbi:hypothetical protein ABPG72_014706 [Tetrahymena utriculariae]